MRSDLYRHLSGLTSLALLVAIMPGVVAAQTYTIEDLGTLSGFEGQDVFASGINANGQVVGWTGDPQADEGSAGGMAWLWDGGVMTALGTLGGTSSFGFGINSAGDAVGSAMISVTDDLHGFRYSGGVSTDLGTLGGTESSARGINDTGQIAGLSTTAGGDTHAFLYDAGAMSDLGVLTGFANSRAMGINSELTETVVGYCDDPAKTDRAFIWDSINDMRDLGPLPGYPGYDVWAYAVNAGIQVVGWAGDEGTGVGRAWRWEAGVYTQLGTLGGDYSAAMGIADSGEVVGESKTAGGQVHAFFWKTGTMTDLNDWVDPNTGWELLQASGINDAGQIVGYGTVGGATRAFLMSPYDPNDPNDDPNDPVDPNDDPNDPVDPNDDPNDPVDPNDDPNDPIDPNDPVDPNDDPNDPNGTTVDPNDPNGTTVDPNDPNGTTVDPNGDPNPGGNGGGGGCCGSAAPLPAALFLIMFWLGLGRAPRRRGDRSD